MKILVIPDVHGRDFWADAMALLGGYDKAVFLGDYLDPYPKEGITFERAMEVFGEILSFAEENRDKVVLLRGNHDETYRIPGFQRTGRTDDAFFWKANALFVKHEELFRLAWIADGFLFCHSIALEAWTRPHGLTVDKIAGDDVPWRALEEVGYSRGGWFPCGSCIWADFREMMGDSLEGEPLAGAKDGIYQVVGHTGGHVIPWVAPHAACLDTRSLYSLDTGKRELQDLSTKVKYLLP